MSLSDAERSTLLQLARETIRHTIEKAPPPKLPEMAGALGEKHGCFVTLTNRHHLRGCIGTFMPRSPLALAVVEMAGEACRDPRFTHCPITAREVPELKVEVSVLSPLERIADPLTLTLGTHGIYIVRGWAAGCFLPEVAAEAGWNVEEFLTHCCEGKAGMAPDAWKDPQTQVYVFTSEKFDQ